MRTTVLGLQPYLEVESAMRAFTAARSDSTDDEIWLVQHPGVYTQGVGGRDAHVLAPGDIPVVRTDRGGQVTYHGPGQVVAYPLVDLRRVSLHVKEYVHRLEEALIDTLWGHGLVGHRVRGAPGVYVRLDDPAGHAVLEPLAADRFRGLGKIAAIGIKVSRHRAWHGIALNVAMDLEPYTRIDPCGYAGLATVDMRTFGVDAPWSDVAAALADRVSRRLST